MGAGKTIVSLKGLSRLHSGRRRTRHRSVDAVSRHHAIMWRYAHRAIMRRRARCAPKTMTDNYLTASLFGIFLHSISGKEICDSSNCQYVIGHHVIGHPTGMRASRASSRPGPPWKAHSPG